MNTKIHQLKIVQNSSANEDKMIKKSTTIITSARGLKSSRTRKHKAASTISYRRKTARAGSSVPKVENDTRRAREGQEEAADLRKRLVDTYFMSFQEIQQPSSGGQSVRTEGPHNLKAARSQSSSMPVVLNLLDSEYSKLKLKIEEKSKLAKNDQKREIKTARINQSPQESSSKLFSTQRFKSKSKNSKNRKNAKNRRESKGFDPRLFFPPSRTMNRRAINEILAKTSRLTKAYKKTEKMTEEANHFQPEIFIKAEPQFLKRRPSSSSQGGLRPSKSLILVGDIEDNLKQSNDYKEGYRGFYKLHGHSMKQKERKNYEKLQKLITLKERANSNLEIRKLIVAYQKKFESARNGEIVKSKWVQSYLKKMKELKELQEREDNRQALHTHDMFGRLNLNKIIVEIEKINPEIEARNGGLTARKKKILSFQGRNKGYWEQNYDHMKSGWNIMYNVRKPENVVKKVPKKISKTQRNWMRYSEVGGSEITAPGKLKRVKSSRKAKQLSLVDRQIIGSLEQFKKSVNDKHCQNTYLDYSKSRKIATHTQGQKVELRGNTRNLPAQKKVDSSNIKLFRRKGVKFDDRTQFRVQKVEAKDYRKNLKFAKHLINRPEFIKYKPVLVKEDDQQPNQTPENSSQKEFFLRRQTSILSDREVQYPAPEVLKPTITQFLGSSKIRKNPIFEKDSQILQRFNTSLEPSITRNNTSPTKFNRVDDPFEPMLREEDIFSPERQSVQEPSKESTIFFRRPPRESMSSTKGLIDNTEYIKEKTPPRPHSLNKYPAHTLNSFYKTHLEVLGMDLPTTIGNLAMDDDNCLEKLLNSKGIVNFKSEKKHIPEYVQELREYKEWVKKVMIGRNRKRAVLTERLSQEKLKRGIVNELTKNKGIEVQIRTEKYVPKNYEKLSGVSGSGGTTPRTGGVAYSARSGVTYISDYFDEFDRRLRCIYKCMKIQKTRDEFDINFKSDIIFTNAMKKRGLEIEKNIKRRSFKDVAHEVYVFMKRLKEIRVNLDDLTKRSIFPIRPYTMTGSKEFFVAVELDQDQQVEKILDQERYMIFQIDSTGKSALHRAAKKGNPVMIRLLLQYHPDVNACDFMGKTALTYAVEDNNRQIAKELLLAKTDPFHDKTSNYIDLCTSIYMENLIKKVRKFWIAVGLCKTRREKKAMWRKLRQRLNLLKDLSVAEIQLRPLETKDFRSLESIA